jgi:hypothetical protein
MGANSFFSKLNENADKPFKGTIRFNDRMISYEGNTLLTSNVSQFQKYGYKKNYAKPAIVMFIGAIAFVFAMNANLGVLGTLASLVIIGYGVYLLMKPKLFGLTIELNSGSCHYFLSADVNGIHKLFADITKCIKESKHFYGEAVFQDNRVTNVVTFGDDAKDNEINL